MGGDFFWKHESAWQCSLSRISLIFARFSPKFQYVIVDTMAFRKCGLRFLIRCPEHGQIFNWKFNCKHIKGLFLLYVLTLCDNVVLFLAGNAVVTPAYKSAKCYVLIPGDCTRGCERVYESSKANLTTKTAFKVPSIMVWFCCCLGMAFN